MIVSSPKRTLSALGVAILTACGATSGSEFDTPVGPPLLTFQEHADRRVALSDALGPLPPSARGWLPDITAANYDGHFYLDTGLTGMDQSFTGAATVDVNFDNNDVSMQITEMVDQSDQRVATSLRLDATLDGPSGIANITGNLAGRITDRDGRRISVISPIGGSLRGVDTEYLSFIDIGGAAQDLDSGESAAIDFRFDGGR